MAEQIIQTISGITDGAAQSGAKRVVCLYRVSTVGQVEKDDIPMQNLVQIIEMQPENRKIKSHISSKRETLRRERKSKSWFFQNDLPFQKNYAPEMQNPPFTDGVNSLSAYPQGDRKSPAALGCCFSRHCYICFVCPLVLWWCWQRALFLDNLRRNTQ